MQIYYVLKSTCKKWLMSSYNFKKITNKVHAYKLHKVDTDRQFT